MSAPCWMCNRQIDLSLGRWSSGGPWRDDGLPEKVICDECANTPKYQEHLDQTITSPDFGLCDLLRPGRDET
jgi:hypothetical protein